MTGTTAHRDATGASDVARTRVLTFDPRHEARAALVVWQRELIRFGKDRTRMVSALVQPLLFLLVLGVGLGSLVGSGAGPGGGTVRFTAFLFPGVLAMSVGFSAAFSGISMVWDREFGFLREMLVAPVSTTAILTGKCVGGATVATLQTVVLLALAGLVGVPYAPVMLLELLGMLFLCSFMIVALGLVLAARVKQVQSAFPLVQMIITPMIFLSGALFPLSGLPGWLRVLTHANPMTYAVEPMRAVVFDHLGADAATRARFDPGIVWGDWPVPVWVQVSLVVAASVLMLAAAVAWFARTE
ncbi:MAG: ABC transporter permease [Actinomycetota bacterium]|nr:ABC transporter permease [Actinomycetota bacterium]